MEVKFEVLMSSSIKRRKPWPRLCWLGKEKESVFLLDDNRISEINLHSGQTRRKIPKLQQLLPRVLTMSSSHNALWLAGLLVSGEVFLWDRDKDSLKMVTSVPAVYELASVSKATSQRLGLLVSGDGSRVVVASSTGQIFLWECLVPAELTSIRDNAVKGRWSRIAPSENSRLPSCKDKEACLHYMFVRSQAVGDVCLCAFIFTAGEELIVTFLKIQWEDTSKNSLKEYCIDWVTKSYPLGHLVPPCRPVKSRGALAPAFSPDGQLLAIILNQKDPRATQVLYVSLQNFVTISSSLGGCGSKNLSIPPKYVRSYWVSSVSWTPDGLYLACILKRGSVLMLARLGGLVSLSTSGCDIEFGPAHFLPLHPLVTYSHPLSLFPLPTWSFCAHTSSDVAATRRCSFQLQRVSA